MGKMWVEMGARQPWCPGYNKRRHLLGRGKGLCMQFCFCREQGGWGRWGQAHEMETLLAVPPQIGRVPREGSLTSLLLASERVQARAGWQSPCTDSAS